MTSPLIRALNRANPSIKHPIQNSPYECPQRYWELDEHRQPTQRLIKSRLRAFAEFTVVYRIESDFKAKVEAEFNALIDQIARPIHTESTG